MSDVECALLREIRDHLKSIDNRLTQQPTKVEYKLNLGRVFSAGQTIPEDVDLVVAGNGVRWVREFEHTAAGSLPTDNWHPRDVEGPVLPTAELLARTGHVTEIPAPASEEG